MRRCRQPHLLLSRISCGLSSAAFLTSFRFCQLPPGVAPPLEQQASPSAPRPLETVAELSDADKKLIREALTRPLDQPHGKLGGAGIGPASGEMVAAFTCNKCETRSVKRFSKHSYDHGIVIVECPGCEVKHLLADNLGWFDDVEANIEQILKKKGEDVIRISNVHLE
jgi:protein import protein ZIM17